MKQMRSRFRLLTLLLACAFFLVFVLCTGAVLRNAGVSLSSLTSLPVAGVTASPDPPPSAGLPADEEPSPAPSETVPEGDAAPGTDNIPDPQYNVFGL